MGMLKDFYIKECQNCNSHNVRNKETGKTMQKMDRRD